MTYTQQNLRLTVSTPLGKDKLLLNGFQGEETISGLFHFTLEMLAEDPALDFKGIVGKHATISLTLGDDSPRHLDGIVSRFYQGGTDGRFSAYYAELRPWLWLLTLSADSQIFQAQSVPDIIQAVFKDLGFSDVRNALSKTYAQREYCVQYQETAFDFVSRLMEDEGIFYFFEHEQGKHTLVLADDADAHKPCPSLAGAVRYTSSLPGDTQEDGVTYCTFEQQVTTGKYGMDDFNFELPSTDLMSDVAGENGKLRVYEYPGGFDKKDAGKAKAELRLQSREWPQTMLRGEGFCRSFGAGGKFELTAHDRDEANQAYVLARVAHQATQSSYSNSYEAFPLSTPFRPPRVTPKATIPGTQTAIVVGKSGEEIWTDKYGRVKVQFHWDQKGKNDENSSCWVRVAQGWAGKGWGNMFIPRVGQEVVVSFLNGDPDRPLITGAVYNAQQTVPYPLPDEGTKSTLKSNSSKGGGGFNELRFEDKKDSEEIYLHAQKDYNVEVLNDETRTITQNRTTTIQKGNDSLTVDKGDRSIQVNTGNETHEVKGKRDLTVTGDETHTDKANFTHEVTGNYELKVKGNLTIDVTGKVTIKAGQDMINQAGMNMTNKAGMSMTNKAEMSMTNEAGLSLSSKGNASQTVESSGIVTVKGTMVKIN
jgi:type VI secretion system secreted protein VgrG